MPRKMMNLKEESEKQLSKPCSLVFWRDVRDELPPLMKTVLLAGKARRVSECSRRTWLLGYRVKSFNPDRPRFQMVSLANGYGGVPAITSVTYWAPRPRLPKVRR